MKKKSFTIPKRVKTVIHSNQCRHTCSICGYIDSHHSMCPDNIINSDSFGYRDIQ